MFRLVSSLMLTVQAFDLLEDFFLANLPQSFSTKSYRGANCFFQSLFGRLPLHSLSAYTFRQKSSLHTSCIVAVCDVTSFISPSAPDIIPSVDCSVFIAFEQVAFWGTIFHFTQYRHYLIAGSYKIQVWKISLLDKNALSYLIVINLSNAFYSILCLNLIRR